MYLVYSALLAAGLLLTLPYWLLQMALHGKYRIGLSERLGRIPKRLVGQAGPAVWIHAVSVGEVLTISGVVAEMRSRFPQVRVVVSTTTDTGQKLARERFGEENVFYFPLDFAFAVRPYLQCLRPQLLVLAETEFWPNLLRLTRESGARVAVVNARISDRSWPGYRRWRSILREILAGIDIFMAQTEEDARRLADIGAPASRVQVSGNLKFDVTAPRSLPVVEQLRAALQQAGGGPVIVCGSTVEGEEQLLLRAFEQVLATHAGAVMMLAPRHPERFEQVAQLMAGAGIRWWRRSQWQGEPLAGGVLLVDTIGELAALYALADIAFVGGSLVPRGGHNIMEPAQFGVPILIGHHTENFRDVVSLFRSRNAVRVVAASELAAAFLELTGDRSKRLALGRRAAETLQLQAGAVQRTVTALGVLLQEDSADMSRPIAAGAGPPFSS